MSIPAALADAVISFSQGDNDAATEALFSANPLSKVSKIAQGVRKVVSNGTKRRVSDFIVSKDGAVVHNSPSAVRSSLSKAGLIGRKISNRSGTETGTIHNVPGMRMDLRVMNGGSVHPARVVTVRQGKNMPVNPSNGTNFGNIPQAEQRSRNHIPFGK